MVLSDKRKNNFVVSQENWSLHRKGYQDQQRHTEKVKEAIKNNLPDLITEENVKSIRPGFGLHPKYLNDLLGMKFKKDVERGSRFTKDII